MFEREAYQEAMKPPVTSPNEMAAVTNIELSLFWSTRFPITSPTPTTTKSEKTEPRNHAERLIRCPSTKNSPRNSNLLLIYLPNAQLVWTITLPMGKNRHRYEYQ